MTSSSQTSMRIILFSVLAAPAIQAIVERLEGLGQQVTLLVVSPGTSKHPIEHYPQIVTGAPHGLDVLVANHMQRLSDLLCGLSPDLFLVAGFPRKLPQALLDLPRLGCVNWHPSLLPRYRGPEPIFWQFMHGERRMGMTFHRMDADIDAGPLLVQRAIEVEPEETVASFFPKLLELTLAALPDVLQAVATGQPGTPQPTEETTYAPHVTDAERWLDWRNTATYLQNQVRVWGSLGGAYTTVEEKRLVVGRAHIIDNTPADPTSAPGSLLSYSAEGLVVQTGQGILLIQEYRTEPAEGATGPSSARQDSALPV